MLGIRTEKGNNSSSSLLHILKDVASTEPNNQSHVLENKNVKYVHPPGRLAVVAGV